MPTSKQRLNLTLPEHVAVFLKKISVRDDLPQATKALELIERALEMEEGEFTARFVKEVKRRTENEQLLSAKDVHTKLW